MHPALLAGIAAPFGGAAFYKAKIKISGFTVRCGNAAMMRGI